MPTLKEIKGRISSVKSTLKITSAMKLVSSAKLHKAQQAAEAMRPYEETLLRILAATRGTACAPEAPSAHRADENDAAYANQGFGAHQADENQGAWANEASGAHGRTVIVAIASNSSLCGGFNANAIAKVREVRQNGDVVYSIGRKMADAMRRDGFTTPEDLNALIEHPAYGPAAALVEKFMKEFDKGQVSEVLLVYNHFVSTAHQVPVVERLLPAVKGGEASDSEESDFIIEPGRKELLEMLEPKTIKLKLYAALLDSAAAEHAARTVAMQMATDNAENLLAELTLQYNKGRQQKITSEILDLAGGQSSD